ncbi:MAG: hypothetical protein GY796_23000 [Chloroflexi bacterium]|nr:hypothetical protein [Chloroflexota bacterium]
MMRYGYNLNATHAAAIFEEGSEAAKDGYHDPDTEGLVVGSSEWIWLSEDMARRICAALTYFSEAPTEEIERLVNERFGTQ